MKYAILSLFIGLLGTLDAQAQGWNQLGIQLGAPADIVKIRNKFSDQGTTVMGGVSMPQEYKNLEIHPMVEQEFRMPLNPPSSR